MKTGDRTGHVQKAVFELLLKRNLLSSEFFPVIYLSLLLSTKSALRPQGKSKWPTNTGSGQRALARADCHRAAPRTPSPDDAESVCLRAHCSAPTAFPGHTGLRGPAARTWCCRNRPRVLAEMLIPGPGAGAARTKQTSKEIDLRATTASRAQPKIGWSRLGLL